MGFMQSTTGSGEDFKTFVKYNAKAGRWYTKEDKPDAEEFEVRDMTAVFDFGSLRTGWFLFAAGTAPIRHLETKLDDNTPRPGEGFKKGFQINLFSAKNLLGVREFASTAGVVIDAMNELYDYCFAAPEREQGKLPVVKCIDVRAITGMHGTNYAPVFQVVSWVERPPELATQADPAKDANEAPPSREEMQREIAGAGDLNDSLEDFTY